MPNMRVSCVVAASPATVFAAFTDPIEIRKWHVPDPEFTVCMAEVDVRVGGIYRIGMQSPNRVEPHVFSGVCRDVRFPERLVYTCRWEPPDRDVGESLVTIEFFAKGGATEVVVCHDGLPDDQSVSDHTRGWTGTLDSLVRHLDHADAGPWFDQPK